MLTRDVNLPVVGLANSETAQVNVVSLAPSAMAVTHKGTAPTQGSSALCTGSVNFYDSAGNVIPPASTANFSISSGQIFSATVLYSEIVPADRPPNSGRTAVRAVVTFDVTVTPGPLCLAATNIETFDSTTGVTHVHADGSPTAPRGFAGFLTAR